MTKLFFTPKTVYGQTLFYPDCEGTRSLAILAKRKTFDEAALSLLSKTYCFEVVINQDDSNKPKNQIANERIKL
tara:strand:+ start:412 stop:633 length:222 start_codon:yes stop_codon:yes gene_type:complete